MNNREKFLEILKDHGIYDDDVEEILYAVTDMLNYMADKMESAEPYAVTTIKHTRDAAHEVRSMVYELED